MSLICVHYRSPRDLVDDDNESRRRSSSILSSLHKQTGYTRQRVPPDDPVVQSLLAGIKTGSRGALAQSITLAESTHPFKKVSSHCMYTH